MKTAAVILYNAGKHSPTPLGKHAKLSQPLPKSCKEGFLQPLLMLAFNFKLSNLKDRPCLPPQKSQGAGLLLLGAIHHSPLHQALCLLHGPPATGKPSHLTSSSGGESESHPEKSPQLPPLELLPKPCPASSHLPQEKSEASSSLPRPLSTPAVTIPACSQLSAPSPRRSCWHWHRLRSGPLVFLKDTQEGDIRPSI